MENITEIQTKPLEFLLDCNVATPKEKSRRLKGIRSIPNENLIIIEDTLYFVEGPKTDYIMKGQDLRPTLYELGKRVN